MTQNHPANFALLTMAAIGAKQVTTCAPCVILAMVASDDLAEFRAAMVNARETAGKAITSIDNQLELLECRRRGIAEEEAFLAGGPKPQ